MISNPPFSAAWNWNPVHPRVAVPAGLYRVNYDEDNWSRLIGQLKTSPADIHVLNRAQLVDDSFNLARADALHYSVPLRLTSYLKTEDDVIPWYSLINGYSYLLDRMRRNDTEHSELKVSATERTHKTRRDNTRNETYSVWRGRRTLRRIVLFFRSASSLLIGPAFDPHSRRMKIINLFYFNCHEVHVLKRLNQ